MAWRPHGRARVDPNNPRAFAWCDRCSAELNLVDLKWQYEWQGAKLQNRRLLVCDRCLDTPQEQLRTIVLPPDPLPVSNPRPPRAGGDGLGPTPPPTPVVEILAPYTEESGAIPYTTEDDSADYTTER